MGEKSMDLLRERASPKPGVEFVGSTAAGRPCDPPSQRAHPTAFSSASVRLPRLARRSPGIPGRGSPAAAPASLNSRYSRLCGSTLAPRPSTLCGVRMALKRKITGGVVALVGYMLSPLSWWNDLWVNVPLALVFAWTVSFFYRPAFKPCLVAGYWLTNVLGFILMHKGAQQALTKEEKKYLPPRLPPGCGHLLALHRVDYRLGPNGHPQANRSLFPLD